MTAPEGTTNEVPVPAGMDLASFTALVTARQGVATFLDPHADASVLTALETSTDAWLEKLGPYFLYELVAQAPAGSPLAARLATYTADHPVTETVTPEQDAAATLAVSNGIAAEAAPAEPAPVVPASEVPAIPAPVASTPALPFTVDSAHPLDSLPAGSSAVKTDANTILTTSGESGIQSQTTIGKDDATSHLPVGSTIDVLSPPVVVPPTQVAITLPANEHRSAITVIGSDVHSAMARAWEWIVDEEKAVVAWVEKEV